MIDDNVQVDQVVGECGLLLKVIYHISMDTGVLLRNRHAPSSITKKPEIQVDNYLSNNKRLL